MYLREIPYQQLHQKSCIAAHRYHRRNAQRIVFMGTSFSVNITSIALRIALSNEAAIEVVDPQPIDLGYDRIEYHRMTAADYVSDRSG